MVALLVAALGVGNLMMANVTNRTRQSLCTSGPARRAGK
jgi:ABC-type antimicrobial peptide transport system permease subunit